MDRMKEGVQKRVRRLQQSVSQNVGLAEKKDELSKVGHVEQRIQKMLAAIKNARVGIAAALSTGTGGRDEQERRKRKLDQFQLHLQLLTDSRELAALDGGSLLAVVMRAYGDALGVLVDELLKADASMERLVLDGLGKYHEDEKSLSKAKDKLNRTALDVESARRRLNGAHDESRVVEIQEEYDAMHLKLDSCKDSVITDMYTLCAKEMDMANLFTTLVEIQTEYHRTAVRTLENLLPDMNRRIATYGRRPVFGCALEDHLRYSGETIAEVLKVCCAALCNQGLTEKVSHLYTNHHICQGLFRVNGNNNRIRRLKAAFDAHEQVLEDYEADPHSICSVLKCYLRELPEPLMTHALHAKWVNAAKMEPDARKSAIVHILREMPKAYLHNLAFLIKFLQLVLSCEQENKMSAGNLSIVFGPNLIGGGTVNESDNMIGSRLVETLLLNADFFFPDDEFPYGVQLSMGLNQKMLDETGGFEMERSPPRSTQLYDNHSRPPEQLSPSGGSLRRMPKPPAPPPPPPSGHMRVHDLSASSEHLIDSSAIDETIASHASSTRTSSDELGETGSGDGDMGETRPSRPPPPRALALNSPNSPRPNSYMLAVDHSPAGDALTPDRPPIAPRRLTQTTTPDNRTLLVVDPALDSAATIASAVKPPVPMKPKQDEITKL